MTFMYHVKCLMVNNEQLLWNTFHREQGICLLHSTLSAFYKASTKHRTSGHIRGVAFGEGDKIL